jgi:hypothetical protein
VVGTTGEPLRNKINDLRKCEGEIDPLKRKGYFERSPHRFSGWPLYLIDHARLNFGRAKALRQ